MNNEVRIIRLEPFQVAASYGFGSGPEEIAWDKMTAFVKTLSPEKTAQARFFGFNNPSPAPGSENYGYEQWVTVDKEIKAVDDIKIKSFPGGLYAVSHCRLSSIGDAWQALVAWREKSRYSPANHQWLEECLTPPVNQPIDPETMEFDLYMPIAE